MRKIEDLNELVERAMAMSGRSKMRPAIVKELLHYDILSALDDAHLLDNLTFQGGTSLRLCYGAARFSEDLYFVGGYNFSALDLKSIKECLEQYIGNRYGLEITVKQPKELASESNQKNIKVDKWQISITTEPEKKDLPKQKLNLK